MFILICRYNRVFADPGDDVALSAHLSPETSAVPMEVRWFRGTECVYLYKNGQVSVGRGFEDRASIFTQELQMGNVSLLLKDVRQTDTGVYCCQVLTGQNKVEKSVHLYMSGMVPLSPDQVEPKLLDQDKEESCQLLELKKLLQIKEEELLGKIKELQTATEILRNNTSLLKYKDTDLEKMSKLANENEERLQDVSRELGACRKDLEQLRLKLRDKDDQVRQLVALLQEQERELTEQDGASEEESSHVLELKALLHSKEKELQAKTKETESITADLSRMAAVLQRGDTDVQNQVEEWVRNMAGQVELCKTELESLRRELLEKNGTVLRLQDRERELEERLSAAKNRSSEAEVALYEAFVGQLLEKTEAMLNRMYQNRDKQLAEIERWIHEKREEKRAKEEQRVTEALEKQFGHFANAVQGAIEEEHAKILSLEKTVYELQDELERAETEDERKEVQTELQGALERHEAVARLIEELTENADEQRKKSEDAHRKGIEEIREKYDVLSGIESETGILKIVLPEVQDYFRDLTSDMRGFLEREAEVPAPEMEVPAPEMEVTAGKKKRVHFEEIVNLEINNNCIETAYEEQEDSEGTRMVNSVMIEEQTQIEFEEEEEEEEEQE